MNEVFSEALKVFSGEGRVVEGFNRGDGIFKNCDFRGGGGGREEGTPKVFTGAWAHTHS